MRCCSIPLVNQFLHLSGHLWRRMCRGAHRRLPWSGVWECHIGLHGCGVRLCDRSLRRRLWYGRGGPHRWRVLWRMRGRTRDWVFLRRTDALLKHSVAWSCFGSLRVLLLLLLLLLLHCLTLLSYHRFETRQSTHRNVCLFSELISFFVPSCSLCHIGLSGLLSKLSLRVMQTHHESL